MGTYFGEVTLIQSHWSIRCEPHVRTRLKRVFPRAPQHAADTVEISATEENSRELLWFLQRFPMRVDREDLLDQLASQHRDREQRLADLLESRRPPTAVVPLQHPPRAYQAAVPEHLGVVQGLLLADDLGLGKTVSAICAMVEPSRLPALVVCPAHMPRQWAQQIQKFAPQLRVHTLRTSETYPLVRGKRGRRTDLWDTLPDVLISSYHKLRGWAETLASLVRLVVMDECQALRTPTTLIYFAARHVARAATQRLGLSATPIYNYGSEIHPVLDVLAPGALGDRTEFLREWCTAATAGDKPRIRDPIEFGAYLRRSGLMLRRTRAEVGRQLPPLQKIPHTIEVDLERLKQLQGDAISLARIVLAHNEAYRGQKRNAAGEFEALMRQATGIAKAPYVADFVRMLIESGEKVVLYGWHHAVYGIWRERLADLNPALYTGTESPSQKAQALEAFTGGGTSLLIMSLRSGAGVDGLQYHCRTAVFGELDWSPGVHEQCMGRLDRDGQVHSVFAYFLLAEDGADPVMSEILGIKREQVEGIRNPGVALLERIDIGEDHIKMLARTFLERSNSQA